MSAVHNKLKTVKMTPANTQAVDRVAKRKTKTLRIPVSRTVVANQAIEIGIKHLDVAEKPVNLKNKAPKNWAAAD